MKLLNAPKPMKLLKQGESEYPTGRSYLSKYYIEWIRQKEFEKIWKKFIDDFIRTRY